jgi:hypothetical protein
LIPDDKRAALRREMEAALMPNQGSKVGKYEHVMKLVNIWMVMKEFAEIHDALNLRTPRLSAEMVHLKAYVECMERFESLATEIVENARQRTIAISLERMPPGELERLYLNPGVELSKTQYPCCPNPNRRHPYFDGPPRE